MMRALAATVLFVVVLTTSLPGLAEPAGHGDARAEFEAGMAAVRRQRWAEALAHFDRSLEARPTAVAHYNRALCLTRLERLDEALRAFEGYLRRYGAELDGRRRAEVSAEISRLEGRVGRVLLLMPEGAEATLLVDGEAAGSLPRAEPLLLLPGVHTLEVRGEGGGAPLRLTLSVTAGRTETVRVELPEAPDVGGLELRVRPVGATVLVDGEPVGTSPLDGPVLAAAGPRRVEARRAGYDPAHAEVTVRAGERVLVELTLARADPLPEAVAGRLVVAASPDGARVLVDGGPFRGEPLPAGPHEVEVALEGHEPWHDVVTVAAGEVRRLEARLSPTAERLDAARRRALRAAGWATSGVAVAALASSLAVLLWNHGRFGDWEREAEALEDPAAEDRDRRRVDNALLLESIHDADVAGWTVLGLGVAALAASVACLVLGRGRRSAPHVAVHPLPGGLSVGLVLTAPE